MVFNSSTTNLSSHSGLWLWYPGYDRFSEPEAWNTWLYSVADVLESLQKDNWYSQNKYDIDKEPKLWIEESKSLNKKRQLLLEDTLKEISQEFFKIWD